MYYVYIIKSLKDNGLYIGFTENLKKRIIEHNQGKTKSIKSRIPFKLIYFEAYMNKADARKREISLKKNGQQRELIKKNLANSLQE